MGSSIPWYRRKDYSGGLTESDKLVLDTIRQRDQHPAASYEDLPDEVQRYINRLELELYDEKQGSEALKAISLTGVAAMLIYTGYTDTAYSESFSYIFGVVIFISAWLQYRVNWKKNSQKFIAEERDAPSLSDRGIQYEWELSYISRLRQG